MAWCRSKTVSSRRASIVSRFDFFHGQSAHACRAAGARGISFIGFS
ncbi:hypothetical protein ACFFX0_24035 [Citricoccus parietis]|uniref:Uncharacterized protein n=1 Tax=Citricoccus parietis TaxID=592307 RepID=A0ABV5G6Q4_9MICC